jgi:hypothetical protein
MGRPVAFALAAVFLVSACADVRKNAVAQITPAEAKELRIVAAQLYKNYRLKPAPEFLPLKNSAWPPRFKKFKPMRVGLYNDGVVLALEGDAASERGLHILPIAMDLAPSRGRVTYEKIQDGVYWYQLGK